MKPSIPIHTQRDCIVEAMVRERQTSKEHDLKSFLLVRGRLPPREVACHRGTIAFAIM
jgi:hypothetical protein